MKTEKHGCPAAASAQTGLDCMTVIVGRGASASGRLIVAHNEDETGRCSMRHGLLPRTEWPAGSLMPAEPGKARIPRGRVSLGGYWTQIRGPQRGCSGGDLFYNEKGVCVFSNSAGGSREDRPDRDCLTDGGIEYDLRRAVAEQATSAREGAMLLTRLVERWGYANSGRCYTVADAQEAFMIQVVRGRHYIAGRLPDDAVCVMPNHYTFHTMSDVPEMWCSPDLARYAAERGWHVPQGGGVWDGFDFARAYQNPLYFRSANNVPRQVMATSMLLGREWDAEREGFPFCVKAERPVTVEDLMRVMETHYEGTELDSVRTGPGNAPHDTPVRRICIGPTHESTILSLDREPLLTEGWIAYGRPCQQPYLPLSPLAGTPEEIDRMADAPAEREAHLEPGRGGVTYRHDGWQAMRDFQQLHEMVYDRAAGATARMKRALFDRDRAEMETAAREAAGLLREGKREEAAQAFLRMSRGAARRALEAQAALMRERFRLARIEPPEGTPEPEGEPLRVCFGCPGRPDEASLIFGMGGLAVGTGYAPAVPGSLRDTGGGRYVVAFDRQTLLRERVDPGEYEFILGGRTEDGEPFAGLTVLTLG